MSKYQRTMIGVCETKVIIRSLETNFYSSLSVIVITKYSQSQSLLV